MFNYNKYRRSEFGLLGGIKVARYTCRTTLYGWFGNVAGRRPLLPLGQFILAHSLYNTGTDVMPLFYVADLSMT